MADPEANLRKLYAFMGVPFGPEEEERMRTHTEADAANGKTEKAFSTFRCVLYLPVCRYISVLIFVTVFTQKSSTFQLDLHSLLKGSRFLSLNTKKKPF